MALFLEAWLLQVWALTVKNFRLLYRLRKLALCESLTPLVIMATAGILTATLSYKSSRVDAARTLATFSGADGPAP